MGNSTTIKPLMRKAIKEFNKLVVAFSVSLSCLLVFSMFFFSEKLLGVFIFEVDLTCLPFSSRNELQRNHDIPVYFSPGQTVSLTSL